MSLFILNKNTKFEHIIGVVFNNWNVLKLAIKKGKGGSLEVMKMKIDDLIRNIHECLLSDDPMCWTAIADIIEDVMDVGFNSVLEDTAADELSQQICNYYTDWKKPENRDKVVDKLKSLTVSIPIQVDKIEKNDDSSETSSGDEGWAQ